MNATTTAPVSVERKPKLMYRFAYILAGNQVSQAKNFVHFSELKAFAESISGKIIHGVVIPDTGKHSAEVKALNASLPKTSEFSTYARHNW